MTTTPLDREIRIQITVDNEDEAREVAALVEAAACDRLGTGRVAAPYVCDSETGDEV